MGVNFSLTALSGINSASTGLGVISNNISNAQTVGFKASRAEFADLFYGSQNSPGQGSRTQTIYQNFKQGAVNDTGNSLDLALNGEGFFILGDTSGRYDAVYTRNGSFKLDKDGYVVDQTGNQLMGYNKSADLSSATNNVYKTVLEPMNIGELNKTPKATSLMDMDLNLNGQDSFTYTTTSAGGRQSTSGVPFTAANLANMSYDGAPNFSTSKMIYDSLGGEHRMTVNYYKVQVNPPGTYPTANASNGYTVNNNQETTDWYSQYILEDYDSTTGKWLQTGSLKDHDKVGADNVNGYSVYSKLTATTAGAGNFVDDAGNTSAVVATPAEAKSAMDAIINFGSPTTQVDASQSAYNAAMSMGATMSQAKIASAATFGVYAQNASFGGFNGGATATAAYDYAIAPVNQGGLGLSALEADAAQAASDAAIALGLPTDQETAFAAVNLELGPTVVGPPAYGAGLISDKQNDVNNFAYNQYVSGGLGFTPTAAKLASLYTVPATAAAAEHVPATSAEASQAAYTAALGMGMSQSQASQAGKAANDAFINAEAYNLTGPATLLNPAQEAFVAAFGAGGALPSVPGAYVQAYRFNDEGKILDFNEDGNFANIAGNTTAPDSVSSALNWYIDIPNNAGVVGTTEALTFDVDLSKFTQYAGNYTIRGVSQDGYKVGDLVGVVINPNGMIEARYSNGRADSVARIALANFPDQQRMEKLGSQMWAETYGSGPRSVGTPQESGFASVQSGALEYSNVDVTGELVNMIFMQKMYQASAQVISTDKQLTQTILQL